MLNVQDMIMIKPPKVQLSPLTLEASRKICFASIYPKFGGNLSKTEKYSWHDMIPNQRIKIKQTEFPSKSRFVESPELFSFHS